MTAVGRGRVPPAPFLRSLSRRPGRGAQLLPLRPWLGPGGSPSLPAASDAHRVRGPQVHSTPVPAALSRPRAHRGSFIPARRRRPLAAPKRRASTRDVSAHGPGCSTRSLLFRNLRPRAREVREEARGGTANGGTQGLEWESRNVEKLKRGRNREANEEMIAAAQLGMPAAPAAIDIEKEKDTVVANKPMTRWSASSAIREMHIKTMKEIKSLRGGKSHIRSAGRMWKNWNPHTQPARKGVWKFFQRSELPRGLAVAPLALHPRERREHVRTGSRKQMIGHSSTIRHPQRGEAAPVFISRRAGKPAAARPYSGMLYSRRKE